MTNINLNVSNPPIPAGSVVYSVDYLVSTNGKFEDEDKIINEVGDTVNLEERTFQLDFTVQDVYYARMILTLDNPDGSKVVYRTLVITRNGDGFSHNNTVIVTPVVTVDGSVGNIDVGGFTISGSEFVSYSGTGSHKYTTYRIRNTNGSVVWEKDKDEYNLRNIRVPDEVLELNRHYIVEVVYYSSSNQPSNTGKLIIKTTGKSKLSTIIDAGNPISTTEDYNELREAYEDLLNIVTNNLALGNTIIGI